MFDTEDARLQLVVKDNDLIQKAKYTLTVNQQKIIAYLISKIKPTDKELQKYSISIADFCELCGINKSSFYTEIREIVDNLDNKSFWVETDEKVFKFRWFSEVEIIKGSGRVNIVLNSNIKQYLIDLSREFTQYELYNILALKGKYSIRLYEYFKSYAFRHDIEVELDKMRDILCADKYKEYKDFKKRVIEPAIKEINEYTDLEVKYEKIMRGKWVVGLKFQIDRKQTLERYNSYWNTIEELNRRNKQLKGQISLFDLSEEEFKEE